MNKGPGPGSFTDTYQNSSWLQNSMKYLKSLHLSFSNSYKKILQRKQNFQIHSLSPSSPWYQNQTKIPQKKRKIQVNITVNIDTKILYKILEIQIQQHIKRIIYHAWSSMINSKDTKICHYLQVNQYDIPHQLIEE